MHEQLPLFNLFSLSAGRLQAPNPLEKLLLDLKDEPERIYLLQQLADAVKALPQLGSCLTPWQLLSHWRWVLSCTLLTDLMGRPLEIVTPLKEKAQALAEVPIWREWQIVEAIKCATLRLLGISVLLPPLFQHPSGAVPFEYGGHWTWAEVPFPETHAELGVYWAMLGELFASENLHLKANRLSHWQCHTLDGKKRPFRGLFNRGDEEQYHQLLAYNALLFHTMGTLTEDRDLMGLANTQIALMEGISGEPAFRVDVSVIALELWWAKRHTTRPDPKDSSLLGRIADPDTALAGFRTPSYSIVATLFGGNTGLGCIQKGEVGVVSYGPQFLPLESAVGFGIEGGKHLESRKEPICFEVQEKTFMMEGDVRIPTQKPAATSLARYGNGAPSGYWLRTSQRFRRGRLDLDTTLYGVEPISRIALAFYLKGEECLVDGVPTEIPFRGDADKVSVRADGDFIDIEAIQGYREAHLVLLPETYRPWGADFLLAYLLDDRQAHYSWRVVLE